MWAERVLQGKRRLAALPLAEECASRRRRALPPDRAWGGSGGELRVSPLLVSEQQRQPGGY